MSQGFLVLSQVVVTLATAHVKECETALLLNLALPIRLLVKVPSLVQNGRTEIVESSLVVMHHHVALSTLVVCHCKLSVIDTSLGKLDESLVDVFFLQLFICRLDLTTFASILLLNRL